MQMEEEEEAEAAPGMLETAARGVAQGASYGLFDEAVGLGSAAKEGAEMLGRKAGLLEPLSTDEDAFAAENPAAGAGVATRLLDAYRGERDKYREGDEAAQRASPKAFIGSTLGGAVLAPGPKGAAAKGAVARTAQFAKTGAKTGAAYGAGTSKADLTKGEILPFLRDLGVGTGTGTLGGAAIGFTSAKLGPWLRKLAEKRAFTALNPRVAMGHGDKMAELAAKSPKADPLKAARDLGRRALDEGIVTPLGTSESAARRAGSALGEAGEMQGALLQSIQDANPAARVSMPGVATALSREAEALKMSPAKRLLAGHIGNQAKAMRESSVDRLLGGKSSLLTLPEAEAEKRALQQAVKQAAKNYLAKGDSVEAKRRAASAMRQAVEDSVERVAGPEDLAQFKSLKARTGQLADIADVAGYGANRQARIAPGGGVLDELSDAASHGQGLRQGLTAKALDALSRAWKERRPATMAALYDAASRPPTQQSAARQLRAGESLGEYLELLRGDKEPLP